MSHDAGLQRLLRRLNRREPAHVPPPPDVPRDVLATTPPSADLAEQFLAQAQAAGCTAEPLAPSDLPEKLARLATAGHWQAAYVDLTLPVSVRHAVLTTLAKQHIAVHHTWQPDAAFDWNASITTVSGAIAETGSLVWLAGEQTPRGASLTPPVHVALVTPDQLVADLATWFARDRTAGTSNATLITGPSKTADIEGVLVTGVHGPAALHIFLLPG